jgi:hypothetical protein
MTARVIRRVLAMDGDEVRFRTGSAARRLIERTAAAVAPPRWRRETLLSRLRRTGTDASAFSAFKEARLALRRRDWFAAHEALSAHFAARAPRFPPGAADLDRIARAIGERFPDAEADARQRGNRLLKGSYALLGYDDVHYGPKPDWHCDAVSGRRAPDEFWADVPYLDPAFGDHKVTWELNRHQHWLQLGRAFKLTRDRVYYERFVSELEGWIDANPPLTGTNWASMLEIGLRSISWLWAMQFFAPAASKSDRFPWMVDLLVALDRQIEHVSRNLSRYFSPNTHLTGEALAMYAVGRSVVELRDAGTWAAAGVQVLASEARRQVAEDGGHVELSGHYHRYSTDFYLLALLVARHTGGEEAALFERVSHAQAKYLRVISDRNGCRPYTGDDDGGQLFPICGGRSEDCRPTLSSAAVVLSDPALALGPTLEETYWFCGCIPELEVPAQPVHWPSTILRATGYHVSRGDNGDHLLFDAGPHGYLNGGHAHADALSVILTVADTPVLIDPGTATYTMNRELRDRFRSTPMHNTVTVNGRPQSQPCGPFHWASTASGRSVIAATGNRCDYFEGTHDGYQPLTHTRAVLAVHEVGWFIVDVVAGGAAAVAEAHWHLHPRWTPAGSTPNGVRIADGTQHPVVLLSSSALEVLGPDSPERLNEMSRAYGRIEPAYTLRSSVRGMGPLALLTCVYSGSEGIGSVQPLAITRRASQTWCSTGFRIITGGAFITLLVSTERNALSASPDGAPGDLWGTDELITDARAACVIAHANGRREAVLVNGRRVLDGAGQPIVDLASRAQLIRMPVATVVQEVN